MSGRALVACALASVLASMLGALAFECPEACECGYSSDEREYTCELTAGNVTITAQVALTATIRCESGVVHCAELPRLPLGRNGTLATFTVEQCALEGPLACMLGALGALGADGLVLSGVTTELTAEHVRGLEGLRALRMMDAAVQHTVPSGALAALPALREFRLRGARLSLTAGVLPAPALHYLELTSDGIAELPPGAFQGLAALPHLQLWDNRIQNISALSFQGLSGLEKLELSRNRLQALHAEAFSPCPRLATLKFFANEIRDLSLRGMQHLREVTAFHNRVEMRFSARALADMPALASVQLTNCKIAVLPHDLLHNSSSLETLLLSGNAIRALPDRLLKDQGKLEKLDLSNNKIAALNSDVFWMCKGLRELNLDNNQIEVLPDQLFSGLSQLKSVRANNNWLKYIASDAFRDATALEVVSLANNQLTLREPPLPTTKPSIHDMSSRNGTSSSGIETTQRSDMMVDSMYATVEQQSPFGSLVGLHELDLSGNRIADIFSDWRFVLIQNLKVLNLARNAIQGLSAADTQFLSSQVTVDLRYNNISSIEVMEAPPWYPREELSTTPTGARILLEGNPFNCDCTIYPFLLRIRGKLLSHTAIPTFELGSSKCATPKDMFGELIEELPPSAVSCPLSRNDCPSPCSCHIRPSSLHLELDCSSLPPALPTPTLYQLTGTELRLHDVSDTLAHLPSHVVSLKLSNMGIIKLPTNIPSTLRDIDLRNNSLTRIPNDLLSGNITVKLSGNPIACDCAHEEDIKVLQRSEEKIADRADVKCSSGESPWSVDAARLCSVQRAALLGGMLAMLGVLAAIAAALTYRYSLQIKVFMYSRDWLRWMVKEEDVDRDKLYDAFISFSHHDEKFVAEKLIPTLESGPRPFKLCVHYRDWIVGEWIPAQIAQSVEQSRRTIIVLSRSFLESVWGTLEFRVAHTRAQKEKRTRVVIILLEDAPPEDKLDAELRAYLSTNTYVKWGDPWFWEKLRYALAGRRVHCAADRRARSIGEKIARSGLSARLTSDHKLFGGKDDKLAFGT